MDLRRIRTDLLALALLAVAAFAGTSLASYDPADPPSRLVHPVRTEPANLCGPTGARVADGLRSGLGFGAWYLVAALVSLDVRLFSRSEPDGRAARLVGWGLSLAALCTACAWWFPTAGDGPIVGAGGYLGAWGRTLLEDRLSQAGVCILIGTTFAAGALLSGDAFVAGRIVRVATWPARILFAPFAWFLRRGKTADPPEPDGSTEPGAATEASVEDPPSVPALPVEEAGPVAAPEPRAGKKLKINPPVSARGDRDALRARLDAESIVPLPAAVALPEVDLLELAEEFPYELLAKKAEIAAATLEKTFAEFGLNVKVVEVDTGPVITQFELELEKGLRLSKVTALADDLAIALRVPAVRVVAPIPGKNTVGVEVPNEKQVMVRLRELIEACPESVDDKRIPLFLGKDVSGRPLVVDMAKMPHLLIAGRTGTGKSVCLNTLILSMLMTRSPDQVKMLMIDPKMVELSPYRRVPHLMHPVITDMKKAEAVLAWAVDKMEERYDLLARVGVRHLDSYNQLGREQVLERLGLDADSPEAEDVPESMPYIVIVADEMADMMMTSGKDVEGHIIRLAQKSRAVGIHLVLATQKPTVDVITGLIKSNLPARIAFQVASRTDSRVVLDEMGADRLLGNGDLLYLAPGTSHLTRAQGTYVSDAEINAVIDFYSDYPPQYCPELERVSAAAGSARGSAGGEGGGSDEERDPLYDEAVEVVIRENLGSVSRLQRFLGIGYGRAARLIDWMADDGVVGESNGSKAREVLLTLDEWEERRAAVAR